MANNSPRKKMFLFAKSQSELLSAEVKNRWDELNQFLDAFPRGPMNLTPDNVKAMPEYKALSSAYHIAFAKLQSFNGAYNKEFAKEIRAERKNRYDRMTAQAV